MKITIHRGTNEIGGSCVEIEHKNTKVLLDAGTPLNDSPASLPSNIESYDGVLISHSHQDHYGLIAQLPEAMPLYIGKVAWDFIQGVSFFKPDSELLPHTPVHVEAGKTFTIGSIKIKPYLVDHSSPDAYGFLLEADGKRVYYSGDFRGHGRKPKTFDHLCKWLPKGIDAMLLEGTMVKRDNTRYSSEEDVEMGILEAARPEEGLVCLSFSSQNIDRLVTAFRAAKQCNRLFVVDIYTAWIMRVAQGISKKIPDISWDRVRVLSNDRPAGYYYGIIKKNPDFFGSFIREIYKPQTRLEVLNIVENPSGYMMRLNENWTGYILDRLENITSTVIYSQWAGYLQEGTPHFNEKAAQLRDRDDSKFEMIHTSGHAVLDDLKRLVNSTKPKLVIPLHTEYKTQYEKHFPNVQVLEDGEVFDL